MTIPLYCKSPSSTGHVVRYDTPKGLFDRLTAGKRPEPRRALAHFFHKLKQWHDNRKRRKLKDGTYPYSSVIGEKRYGGVCYRWIQKVTKESESVFWNHKWWAATEGKCREGQCQGIRLTDQVLNGEWEVREFTAKSPRKKSGGVAKASKSTAPIRKTPPLGKALLENLRQLEVDPSFRDNPEVGATDFNYLMRIHNGSTYTLGKNTHRLSHPFLRMSRKNRHYVTWNGEPIVSVDSKNGYPSNIGWILTNQAIGSKMILCPLLSTVPASEVDRWLSWLPKDFYAQFKGERTWVKQRLSMLLSNPTKFNALKNQVRELYPHILDWMIEEQHMGGMARCLQRIEVELILCHVCPALHKEGYFWLPANDGIFTVPSQVDKVHALIQEVAQSVGFPGSFSIKGVGE